MGIKEEWKIIPNYENYMVSNLGRIKSLNYNRQKIEKIMKFKGTKQTGNRITLWNKEGCKDFLVARLVAFTFYKKDINNHNLTVNHIDGNRFNNNLYNLELITLRENIQHGFRTGLYKKCQKKIRLFDKEKGINILLNSLNEGNRFLGKNHSYLSTCIKRNIYENERYKWKLC